MFEWLNRLRNKATPTAAAPALAAPDAPPVTVAPPGAESKADAGAEGPAGEADHFFTDAPIAGAKHDRFNRAPFASRIADTIARRPDSSSIVIGVFGPWGDGKTSVLQMMEEALSRHDSAIVIKFNPWHFQSEEQLIRGFFATLAEGLNRKLKNAAEKIGGLLQDYGSVLSLASLSLGGVQIRTDGAAKGLGEALANVSLDTLRARIEGFLDESGKRVVILVDDIDRLDRQETHSIFKLVKLSAGFRHTSYVLAFDDEIVAAALGERYGAGGHQAGRAFLEKIIQVPLHLPPVDRLSLRGLAWEGVSAALRTAEIELPQAQQDAFMRHYVDALEASITTPRLAKLYTNALMFALPLLKGEVNIMNLMLLEGIRVLFPALYTAIHHNEDLFLRGQEHRLTVVRTHDEPPRLDLLLEQALPGMSTAQRNQIRDRLLQPLFPRIGNSLYMHDWDPVWHREQRVCATQYFKRYFSYTVPDGDISDSNVNAFIEAALTGTPEMARSLLDAFFARRAIPRLIDALNARAEGLDAEPAMRLATVVASNGAVLPRERGPSVMFTTVMDGAALIARLLRCVPSGEQRRLEAERILGLAMPLPFAVECLRFMNHDPEDAPERHIVSAEENPGIQRIVANRIAAADADEPIYLSFPQDTLALYWVWRRAHAQEASAALQRRLERHPEEMDVFLDRFVNEAWGIESGLPSRDRLRRDGYNHIVSLVPGDVVVANLRARYGEEIDSPNENGGSGWTSARRLAHQFAQIHRAVIEDEAGAGGNAAAEVVEAGPTDAA